jgi:CrcB protein
MVGIGGFIGSICRYAVSVLAGRYLSSVYPIGTFIINLLGCFIIGLLFGMVERQQWLQGNGWLILATGFCGGFTTFSAFALENVGLLQKGQGLAAMGYTCLSVVLGILLCRAGLWLAN